MSFLSISFSRIVPLDSEDSLYFVKTVSRAVGREWPLKDIYRGEVGVGGSLR